MPTPIIYNIFPLLAGTMDRWMAHARRARDMGFDWIYLNPVHYPGFSGSLYAVKEYFRLNPLLVPEGTADPLGLLGETLEQIRALGLRVMMDLVINHTARDSPLTRAHPEWYLRDAQGRVKSPSAMDPANANHVTVWGDLAEIDNAGSPDRQGLWAFWTHMAQRFLELGCDGYRCDAAYKVPADLWRHLISGCRQVKPDAFFCAETLGCRLAEVRALEGVGFDSLFNSVKYWNFDAPWALDQHEAFADIAPSIGFPESHDTPRLWHETGGLLQVQKQRYAVAACFSGGLLMPIGYEYGFEKPMNVVRTRPQDWEETGVDLSAFIARVNRLKREVPVLGEEGRWEVVTTLSDATTVLKKSGRDTPARPVLLCINKDWNAPQTVRLPPLAPLLGSASAHRLRLFDTDHPGPQPMQGGPLSLGPAEVVLVRGDGPGRSGTSRHVPERLADR